VPNVRTEVLVGVGVSQEGYEISHPQKGGTNKMNNCNEIKETSVPSQSNGLGTGILRMQHCTNFTSPLQNSHYDPQKRMFAE
jgi:hypothetical protein